MEGGPGIRQISIISRSSGPGFLGLLGVGGLDYKKRRQLRQWKVEATIVQMGEGIGDTAQRGRKQSQLR